MKKILGLVIVAGMLMASEMPPMPPGMGGGSDKSVKTKKKNKSGEPKECNSVPPMIYILPPPLEAELKACKDAFFKPKKELAQKQLSKNIKGIKVKDIAPVKAFDMLYEIKHNQKSKIYCNKTITSCFVDGKLIDIK
jgi:hypothetical protein